MKWIGAHIWDFVSRFRNDVYLENIVDGTVDSDKFLGLDENGKIVKEAVSAGHDAVTVAGSLDYITLSGQALTRNAIDLTTDVTGILPSANLDADTAHLSGTQTFTGVKSFSATTSIDSRKYALPSDTVGDFKGGDIWYYGDGSTVKGSIYYVDGTNWTLADADAESSASGLLAVALGTNPGGDGMLLRGFVTLLTGIEGTEAIGSPIFLSATDSGKATITAPSGDTDIVRVLGYSLHATENQIYFNPDNTFVEVTA